MKDTLMDANFPRTSDLRVYHLGIRPGEVANRIITVGSHARARTLQTLLDAEPAPFVLASERGFLTITGRYKRVPISIVSIGMGAPNMDFFVREVRECLSGDMVVIRFGSCGALVNLPLGTIVVPKASVTIMRNVDYDFINSEDSGKPPYIISKPVSADPLLHETVLNAFTELKPQDFKGDITGGMVNASADSFYSSQGRHTSFPDDNANLIDHLRTTVPDVATLEMETFHLFHLAACWKGRNRSNGNAPPSLANEPADSVAFNDNNGVYKPLGDNVASSAYAIRAASAQIVFAARKSQDFITPEEVKQAEQWGGAGVLSALVNFGIPRDRVHPDKASVWEYTE
ncbi:hypothetical protein AX14_012156 [Amanita brunnescens Koide BX004]|nr:hypothetical protein AX14_012156 [Amanita brunnescens Koide BX004]